MSEAVKILQIEKSCCDGQVLLVNLQQLLLVWTLVTLLKIGSFTLYPGKDYLLVGSLALLFKCAHIKRDSLLTDVAGVTSIIILLSVILVSNPIESLLTGNSEPNSLENTAPTASLSSDCGHQIGRAHV